MDNIPQILIAFELHSVESINECCKQGVNPNDSYKGEPLIYHLINMYSRGPKFKACVQAMLDNGLVFEDKLLLAVLLDDAVTLEKLITANSSLLQKRYTLQCTFTPLQEASLLHICAEYNHLNCAKVLVSHGMDVNTKAGVDENGFGGHTAIFHTVNQHANRSIDVLKFLLECKADLSITVKGLIWGKGYDWETFIPSVNPISYAMMGLLRQFQRTENDIYEIVSLLMKAQYGSDYVPSNIPNKYLNS
ncbi:MAG: ankyrin repeat domain-containing protein [Sphingobacteriales bacterium]|nr:ankyrin repeat domain-containing protein [Sphingobacteriales bacterium]MBI3719126.1 ankyrin repeat domain-containing protein [Sphingobacteriales bacterium]